MSCDRAAPPRSTEVSGLGAERAPVQVADLTIECGEGVPISPLIYGIAYDFMHDRTHTHQWQLGATVRRWGGNPSSRYNWELGNAWNTAQDWYWENTDFGAGPGFSYVQFLRDNDAHGVRTALTVPMLGWVAKDRTSYGFPVSVVGPQDAVDPWKKDAGNGMRGKQRLPPLGQTRTSVPAPPEFIGRWVAAMRAEDRRAGRRSVHQYILDNEPALWNSTHRDVHPEPVTYEELLDRTIQYGSAVRAADPDAGIAGPAEWGWLNYLASASDVAGPRGRNADRHAHGGVPLIPWYLSKLREHEQRTSVRVLDVLDLHFYPQGKNVFGQDDSPAVAALRIRSTRALWDPRYVDESWIGETIMLIPRMKQWVAENYPGRGISIGEWNFGGERHMSGGLAAAEALGRFGQGGVTSAFYWVYPPAGSPVSWAFRAYRNFDGRGGRFLDRSLPTSAIEGTSIFASRDDTGKHLVAVVLNFSPKDSRRASVALRACGAVAGVDAYSYGEGSSSLAPGKASAVPGGISVELGAYSMTVLDIKLAGGEDLIFHSSPRGQHDDSGRERSP